VISDKVPVHLSEAIPPKSNLTGQHLMGSIQ
jgi:hypothetical protein